MVMLVGVVVLASARISADSEGPGSLSVLGTAPLCSPSVGIRSRCGPRQLVLAESHRESEGAAGDVPGTNAPDAVRDERPRTDPPLCRRRACEAAMLQLRRGFVTPVGLGVEIVRARLLEAAWARDRLRERAWWPSGMPRRHPPEGLRIADGAGIGASPCPARTRRRDARTRGGRRAAGLAPRNVLADETAWAGAPRSVSRLGLAQLTTVRTEVRRGRARGRVAWLLGLGRPEIHACHHRILGYALAVGGSRRRARVVAGWWPRWRGRLAADDAGMPWSSARRLIVWRQHAARGLSFFQLFLPHGRDFRRVPLRARVRGNPCPRGSWRRPRLRSRATGNAPPVWAHSERAVANGRFGQRCSRAGDAGGIVSPRAAARPGVVPSAATTLTGGGGVRGA